MRAAVIAACERADPAQLRSWRCPHCGARLFDANVTLREGQVIACRCRTCRRVVTFTGAPAPVDDNERVV